MKYKTFKRIIKRILRGYKRGINPLPSLRKAHPAIDFQWLIGGDDYVVANDRWDERAIVVKDWRYNSNPEGRFEIFYFEPKKWIENFYIDISPDWACEEVEKIIEEQAF